MSAVDQLPRNRPFSAGAPTFPRLLNTELRRFGARRFTRVLLGLSVVGYLAAMIFLWATHAQPSEADYAQATAQRDQSIASMQQYYDDCIAAPDGSAENCGYVPSAAEFPVDQYLANDPFDPRQVQIYALAVGVAVALAGFMLGATFIGAEWSSKNLVAWLFYEPRRLRLLGAKILVLCGVLVVLAFIAQAVWLGSAQLLMAYRGVGVSSLGEDAAQFWPDTLAVQLRAALLILPGCLLGFGLANLIRNTAAALGIAFAYFIVLENVAAAISPGLQPYQFGTAIAAWVSDGGIDVYGRAVFDPSQGYVTPEVIHVSNLHGGVTLLVYALVVLVVSVQVFRRRDIT